MGPSSCYLGPSVISSPRGWAGPTKSCPVNRIQQKWWDVISKVRLLTLEMVAAVLLSLPLPHPTFNDDEDTVSWDVLWRIQMARNWVLSSDDLGPQWNSPWEPDPAKTHVSDLESSSFPRLGLRYPRSLPTILTAAYEGPWARGASEAMPRILSHRNWQIIDVVLCN